MFYKYEIKNNGKEDILYLYLSMAYEFSKELVNGSNTSDVTRRTKNFIKNNKINFNSGKVFLVVNGIIVKTVDIKNLEDDIEVLSDKLFYSNENYLVTVRLEDDSKIEITLKEYLRGVLATNLFSNMELDTLKVLSIMYRTYIFSKMNKDKYIDFYDKFALFKPISYYKLTWINNYDEIIKKFDEAIDSTDCLFLTYENDYILPFMHYSNYGSTFSNLDYPYLDSVKSLWDLASPYYVETNDYSYDLISRLLNVKIDSKSNFYLLDMDDNENILKIKINDKVFTGEELKSTLNLKSLNMVFIVYNKFVRIITKGWGNCLGLSIYGANELAKDGCDFNNIIKYYFPKIKINKYVKEA